jgi:2-polyprenyl-6-methoxyphenol hydroxylase-like FAD-dependent oxidoreductase
MTKTAAMAPVSDIPVLIVGGSLVGLATSMFLSMHDVRCLSVEKHRGTAIHPRAGYFQLRTLEMLRQAGIEERVRSAAHALYDPDGGLNAVETLAGREIQSYIPNINQDVYDISPCRRLFMPQQVLEPILKEQAIAFGSRFEYATELVDFTQDTEGVTATVRDIDNQAERRIRAQYLVACDGNRSPIREQLDISTQGHPLMSHSVTIYFRADCSRALRGRNLGVIYVNNPRVSGFFRLEKTGLGGFLVVFLLGDSRDPAARNAAEGMTVEKAAQVVRDAVGDPELDVKVEDIAAWRAICFAADRLREGRIFIAGDAAHTMTPTGGFGGNTGIQDAHNLAWKLACVTRGEAGPALLDTYDAERQPVARLAIEQAYTRYVTRSDPDIGTAGMQVQIPDMHVEFNRYRSAAVMPDPAYRDDGAVDIDPRKSMGLPGTRAPHIDLRRADGQVISTLDLYGRGFVVMAAHAGSEWVAAARVAEKAIGIPLDVHLVAAAGADAPLADMLVHRHRIYSPFSNPFPIACGIESDGALLVRPDGYVGWRCRTRVPDAAAKLTAALHGILCR